MQLELLKWGDGSIRLTFWDTMHGKDVVFILDEDGSAYVEQEDETRTAVDLALELRKMSTVG